MYDQLSQQLKLDYEPESFYSDFRFRLSGAAITRELVFIKLRAF
jgi:hypothetical protein